MPIDHERPRRYDGCSKSCRWVEFPAGTSGNTPNEITDPAPSERAGADGAVTIAKATWSDLANHISPSHTGMVLFAAERDYINGRFEDSLERLQWLNGVLFAALNSKGKYDSVILERYKAQRDKANSLIDQMRLGLDFYGQHYNYVPLLSVQYYNDVLDQMIAHAEAIERSYLIYQDQHKSAVEKIQAVQSTKDQVIARIADCKSRQSEVSEQQKKLQDEIAFLLGDLSSLWTQLFDSEQNFQNAVASNGPGCGFKDIVTFGAAVSTLIGSGGTAAAAIGVAFSAIKAHELKDDSGNVIKPGFAELRYKVDRIVVAGKTAQSFMEAYNVVKDAIQPTSSGPEQRNLPSDEAKIVAAADDIDREVEKFAALSQAREYQQLIRRFVSSSQTRNNKILQYQAAAQLWNKLDADIRQAQLDADALSVAIARTNNPFVGEAKAFMERAWLEARLSLVQVMHQLNRSQIYYSLRDEELQVTGFSVAALRATALNLLAKYVRQRETVGSDPQRYLGKTIDMTPYLTKTDLDRFRREGIVTATIPISDSTFGSRCHVRASKVWVSLEGSGEKPKRLNVTMSHHGNSQIRGERGQIFSFVHVPIKIAYETNDDGNPVFDGTIQQSKGDYEGVAPFGTWTIQFDDLDPAFRNSVSAIKIHLDGWARA